MQMETHSILITSGQSVKSIGIIYFVGCGESGGTEIHGKVVGHKSY